MLKRTLSISSLVWMTACAADLGGLAAGEGTGGSTGDDAAESRSGDEGDSTSGAEGGDEAADDGAGTGGAEGGGSDGGGSSTTFAAPERPIRKLINEGPESMPAHRSLPVEAEADLGASPRLAAVTERDGDAIVARVTVTHAGGDLSFRFPGVASLDGVDVRVVGPDGVGRLGDELVASEGPTVTWADAARGGFVIEVRSPLFDRIGRVGTEVELVRDTSQALRVWATERVRAEGASLTVALQSGLKDADGVLTPTRDELFAPRVTYLEQDERVAQVAASDDGSGCDAVPADGIYSACVPADAVYAWGHAAVDDRGSDTFELVSIASDVDLSRTTTLWSFTGSADWSLAAAPYLEGGPQEYVRISVHADLVGADDDADDRLMGELWGRTAQGEEVPVAWFRHDVAPRMTDDGAKFDAFVHRAWIDRADVTGLHLRDVQLYDRYEGLQGVLPHVRLDGEAPPPVTVPEWTPEELERYSFGPIPPFLDEERFAVDLDPHAVVYGHGWCAGGNPFVKDDKVRWPLRRSSGGVELDYYRLGEARNTTRFDLADLLYDQIRNRESAAFVGHSQGGLGAMELFASTWTALDAGRFHCRARPEGWIIQAIQSPWLGTKAAKPGRGTVGKWLGFGCGPQHTLQPVYAQRALRGYHRGLFKFVGNYVGHDRAPAWERCHPLAYGLGTGWGRHFCRNTDGALSACSGAGPLRSGSDGKDGDYLIPAGVPGQRFNPLLDGGNACHSRGLKHKALYDHEPLLDWVAEHAYAGTCE